MTHTFKNLCRAFGVYPSYLYQLEARGILPERPRGAVPLEYVRRVIEHRRGSGCFIPPEADLLLMELEAEHEQQVTS